MTLPRARRAPLRILVVDDHRDTADSMTILLLQRGFEVAAAYDGLQAVALAGDWSPDVVLLDLVMPGLDGASAAERIRTLCPAALLVAITGYVHPEALRRCAQAGFDRHFAKPIDIQVLVDLLQAHRPSPARARV
jgi:CheY-like chemotaxis protein